MQSKDFEDINIEELIADANVARNHHRHYTQDAKMLSNLADGVPVNRKDTQVYVGDTTVAGLIRAMAREAIQAMPVFAAVVNGSKLSKEALFCSYLLRSNVFNEDTFGKGLLSTIQIGVQESLTHGHSFMMAALDQVSDEFGSTMRILHHSNVDPEPGIQDQSEATYNYVSIDITKSRLRKIYNAAKNNPNTTWNLKALKELLEINPTGDGYSEYESEANSSEPSSDTYKLTTKYESGKGGKFITFCKDYTQAPLRVVKNKSKFGFPRVNMLVIDPAGLHPFGVSRVKLASPWQNLANAYLLNVVSVLLLNAKPPLMKRGRFIGPVEVKQSAVWEAQDPNANAQLVSLDNGTLQHFTPFLQQMTSQMQNIIGMPTGTVNGNSNAFGFSKTAPGVKMQERFQNSAMNQVTSLVENFLRQYALSALDILLSEQSGESTLIVDDEFKDAINRIGEREFVPSIDPNTGIETKYTPLIGDDNKWTVNWEDFYLGTPEVHPLTGQSKIDPNTGEVVRSGGIETLAVEIEIGASKDELDEKKRADLQDMLTVFLQNPSQDPEAQARARELTNMLMEKMVPEAKTLPSSPQPSEAAPPITTQLSDDVSFTQYQ